MHLLFDIGGTKSRFAFTEDLKTFKEEPLVFHTSPNFDEELELIKSNVRFTKFETIVGGLPGILQNGKLIFSPNLLDFVNKDIRTSLTKIFNFRKLELMNDAKLSALGEAHFGAGMGIKKICYITLSTGIGGALVFNGNLSEVDFFEPGHMIRQELNNKTFEETISGGAIKEMFNGQTPDASSTQFWEEIEDGLATLLVNIYMISGVDAFILGGGIVIRGNLDLSKIRGKFIVKSRIPLTPIITKTKLGDFSGLYGALLRL